MSAETPTAHHHVTINYTDGYATLSLACSAPDDAPCRAEWHCGCEEFSWDGLGGDGMPVHTAAPEVTPAIERAMDAWFDGDPHHNLGQVITSLLDAALDVEDIARVLNAHAPAPADGMDARFSLRNGCSCGRMAARENRQAHVATAIRALVLGGAA